MSKQFRFGPFQLDLQARTLRANGELVELSGKPFDALVVLLENAGQVVGKEKLIGHLWPDTAVQDQTLVQHIFVIRKALGEDSRNAQWIRTVHGRGYSFVGEVTGSSVGIQPPTTRAASAGAAEGPGLTGLSRPRHWLVAGGVIAFVAAMVWVTLGRSNYPLISVRPLTSFRGGEYEPAFSPAADRIAFVWDGLPPARSFDIWVQDLDGANRVQITRHAAAEGSPVWSPDGKRIAFVRYNNGPESGVYVVPVDGGLETLITPVRPQTDIYARHLDWSPNGDLFAVVDQEDGRFAIFLVSAATGKRWRLTSPPAGTLGDTAPSFSPDGTTLLFRRSVSAGSDLLYKISVGGGREDAVLAEPASIRDAVWGSVGSHLFFGGERGGRSGIWRLVLSSKTSELLSFGETAYFLAASRRGGHLAYSQTIQDCDLMEAELGAFGNGWRTLTGSTRNETSGAYSPDGKQVAYRSDRTGSTEIWVSEISSERVTQLTHMSGPLTGSPRWSPNGLQVVFDSRPRGNGDVLVTPVTGGPPAQVTTDPADDVLPTWSPDGKWIYFSSNRSGTWELWRTDPQGEAASPAQRITRHGGFAGRFSKDGIWVYYAKSNSGPGLWRVPAAGGREELVLAEFPASHRGYFVPYQEGVLAAVPLLGGNEELVYVAGMGRGLESLTKLQWPIARYDGGLDISPDGTKLLCTRTIRDDSDLFLVSNIH